MCIDFGVFDVIYCNCKKELFAKINNGGIADADIPETLTRAQLEAHGAVARLREENDEFTFVYLNAETAIGFTIRKASNSYNLYCKCKL